MIVFYLHQALFKLYWLYDHFMA